jgi:hypothetical protein
MIIKIGLKPLIEYEFWYPETIHTNSLGYIIDVFPPDYVELQDKEHPEIFVIKPVNKLILNGTNENISKSLSTE